MRNFRTLLVILAAVSAIAVVDYAKAGFATDHAGSTSTSAVSILINDLDGPARIRLDGSAISRPIGVQETYQVKCGAKGKIFFGGKEYIFQADQKEVPLSAVTKVVVEMAPKEAPTAMPVLKRKTVFVNNTDGLVRVRVGYVSTPVVSGDTMIVTEGDLITVSDGTRSLEWEVGQSPIGAAQLFNGSDKAVAFGALRNNADDTVFVSLDGSALARPLSPGELRYFATGANATVRFDDGTVKTVGIMHDIMVADLIDKPQTPIASTTFSAAPAVAAGPSTKSTDQTLAVAKVVNVTGLTLHVRRENQYLVSTLSPGGVLEFQHGEKISVKKDGFLTAKITLAAAEVYLMRDGEYGIVAVKK